jgi:hypothetical protein
MNNNKQIKQTSICVNKLTLVCSLRQPCIGADLELYVIPKTQPDTALVNLTDWMTNTTAQPTPDTLNTYPGFVLRRLAEGTGVIVNVNSG